jgi:regulator of cell morphogenesis and NO signaling
MPVLSSQTLGDLVAEAPGRAAVFERAGIDYCCHGQRTLADACATAGLDTDAIAAALDDSSGAGAPGHPTELAPLSEFIEATHHRYLHEELPLLEALAAKVADVHGGRHPELAAVARLVRDLRADLEPHLMKEERILFPAIRALAAGHRDLPFGSIAGPISVMNADHERDGDVLAALRSATGDYAVPADGCASYHSLYERLAALEADTHRHIHLENNVLFPAALAAGEDPGR